MKPIISPVPGALVFLCADGVYTEAPLYVGLFDCGFVRNPRGEGYLCLHYVGETSVPGVTYSGVWGAVLAKAKFGNHTVVTPSPQPDHPQADYPQADWSKENQGDAGTLRSHLNYIVETAGLYVAHPTGNVGSLLAAVGRIDARTSAIRAVGIRIIGSYQKGA
jgi:hypothetical protein